MSGLGLAASMYMGARSLNNQRNAIEVTGHNLSNVNTPGAARQRVNFQQDIQLPLGNGVQGLGSKIVNIQSLRAAFLDAQVVRQNSLTGLYEQRENLASLVQDSLGESLATSESAVTEGITSATGLQESLKKFYDSWQDLASDPNSNVKRQEVMARATNLTNDIQATYNRVLDTKQGIFELATATTARVNSLSTDIANLNDQIARLEINSQSNANDLRDQRQQLVEELSELVNITVTTNGTNSDMIDIELTDNAAVDLVIGTDGAGAGTTQSLSVTAAFTRATNSALTITASTTGALATTVPSEGELAAMVQITGNVIGDGNNGPGGALPGTTPANSDTLMEKLNYMTSRLISLVNAQHTAGEDLSGAAGANFFSGTNATDIAVNVTNANNIAASGAGLGELDGTQAQAIANLRDNVTLGEVHRMAVSDVGTIVQQAKRNSNSQALIQQEINNQREAVSGISIDEEMTNLVVFQRAYEASARFIGVIDEMMSRVVNLGAGR